MKRRNFFKSILAPVFLVGKQQELKIEVIALSCPNCKKILSEKDLPEGKCLSCGESFLQNNKVIAPLIYPNSLNHNNVYITACSYPMPTDLQVAFNENKLLKNPFVKM